MDRRRLGWVVRGASFAVVFALGLVAFQLGVGATDRPHIPDASFLVHVYYALGLFVLGGMDLGTPLGGSGFGRALLWTAYFLAPIVTTGAVLETAFRLVGRTTFERRRLRDHFVVAGLGKLGIDFMTALRSWAPKQTLVAVSRDAEKAAGNHVRRHFGARAFAADIKHKSAFHPLSLERARGVALLTDDDLLNLEVAFRLAHQHPQLNVIAHVSDIALERAVNELEPSAVHQRVHLFNAHRIAAEHLYEHYLSSYFRETAAKDVVVVAGFGRFGQSIVEFLEGEAGTELAGVIITDRSARTSLRTFQAQVRVERAVPRAAIDGDLLDPETWNAIGRELESLKAPPVFVIGCDDDRVNLRSAMYARRRWPEARIFVRCQNASSFTDSLGSRCDFTTLSIDAVVTEALKAAQLEWFGPDRRSLLPRKA
jgi:Trk K+ transport system NAD-binding subunit